MILACPVFQQDRTVFRMSGAVNMNDHIGETKLNQTNTSIFFLAADINFQQQCNHVHNYAAAEGCASDEVGYTWRLGY